jgi:hypothetical protein
VSIEGCLATTANGTWQIIVTGSHTFILDNSTFGSVVAAGGYALDYSVSPLITIPDDGDPRDASSVNPALEESANIVPFLNRRCGQYNLLNVDIRRFSDSTSGPYASVTPGTTSFTFITGSDIDPNTTLTDPYPFKILPTDLLEIEWSFVCDAPAGGQRLALAIGLKWDGLGYAPASRGVIANLASDFAGPLILRSIVPASDYAPLAGGSSLTIGLMAQKQGVLFRIDNPFHLQIKHYRLNG